MTNKREYAAVLMKKVLYYDGAGILSFCSLCEHGNDLASYWLNDFSQEHRPTHSSKLMFSCLHANSIICKLLAQLNSKALIKQGNAMYLAEQLMCKVMVNSDGASIGWNLFQTAVTTTRGQLTAYVSVEFDLNVIATSTTSNNLFCCSCLSKKCRHLSDIVHPDPVEASTRQKTAVPVLQNLISTKTYPCNSTY
jgi:hypothetical protein